MTKRIAVDYIADIYDALKRGCPCLLRRKAATDSEVVRPLIPSVGSWAS